MIARHDALPHVATGSVVKFVDERLEDMCFIATHPPLEGLGHLISPDLAGKLCRIL